MPLVLLPRPWLMLYRVQESKHQKTGGLDDELSNLDARKSPSLHPPIHTE